MLSFMRLVAAGGLVLMVAASAFAVDTAPVAKTAAQLAAEGRARFRQAIEGAIHETPEWESLARESVGAGPRGSGPDIERFLARLETDAYSAVRETLEERIGVIQKQVTRLRKEQNLAPVLEEHDALGDEELELIQTLARQNLDGLTDDVRNAQAVWAGGRRPPAPVAPRAARPAPTAPRPSAAGLAPPPVQPNANPVVGPQPEAPRASAGLAGPRPTAMRAPRAPETTRSIDLPEAPPTDEALDAALEIPMSFSLPVEAPAPRRAPRVKHETHFEAPVAPRAATPETAALADEAQAEAEIAEGIATTLRSAEESPASDTLGELPLLSRPELHRGQQVVESNSPFMPASRVRRLWNYLKNTPTAQFLDWVFTETSEGNWRQLFKYLRGADHRSYSEADIWHIYELSRLFETINHYEEVKGIVEGVRTVNEGDYIDVNGETIQAVKDYMAGKLSAASDPISAEIVRKWGLHKYAPFQRLSRAGQELVRIRAEEMAKEGISQGVAIFEATLLEAIEAGVRLAGGQRGTRTHLGDIPLAVVQLKTELTRLEGLRHELTGFELQKVFYELDALRARQRVVNTRLTEGNGRLLSPWEREVATDLSDRVRQQISEAELRINRIFEDRINSDRELLLQTFGRDAVQVEVSVDGVREIRRRALDSALKYFENWAEAAGKKAAEISAEAAKARGALGPQPMIDTIPAAWPELEHAVSLEVQALGIQQGALGFKARQLERTVQFMEETDPGKNDLRTAIQDLIGQSEAINAQVEQKIGEVLKTKQNDYDGDQITARIRGAFETGFALALSAGESTLSGARTELNRASARKLTHYQVELRRTRRYAATLGTSDMEFIKAMETIALCKNLRAGKLREEPFIVLELPDFLVVSPEILGRWSAVLSGVPASPGVEAVPGSFGRSTNLLAAEEFSDIFWAQTTGFAIRKYYRLNKLTGGLFGNSKVGQQLAGIIDVKHLSMFIGTRLGAALTPVIGSYAFGPAVIRAIQNKFLEETGHPLPDVPMPNLPPIPGAPINNGGPGTGPNNGPGGNGPGAHPANGEDDEDLDIPAPAPGPGPGQRPAPRPAPQARPARPNPPAPGPAPRPTAPNRRPVTDADDFDDEEK